jgi:hypothetical protein
MTESTKDLTPNPHYEKEGFVILPNFIPPFFAQFLREYFDTLKTNDKLEEGDPQVNLSSCLYGDPCYDTFMLMSTELISRSIGIELLPTYTYGRIYYTNAELLPHTDREECEHSVSLFLGGKFDKTWPMWMMNSGVHNEPQMAALNPGDAIVYKGNTVNHWRDSFEGESHYQLFMHYVEKNGKHADREYDTRPYLGLPSITKRDYGHSTDQQPSEDSL